MKFLTWGSGWEGRVYPKYLSASQTSHYYAKYYFVYFGLLHLTGCQLDLGVQPWQGATLGPKLTWGSGWEGRLLLVDGTNLLSWCFYVFWVFSLLIQKPDREISVLLVRWLKTISFVSCKITTESSSNCIWRRLQVHEQQSEKVKKNVLQKVLTFNSRALQLQLEDSNATVVCFGIESKMLNKTFWKKHVKVKVGMFNMSFTVRGVCSQGVVQNFIDSRDEKDWDKVYKIITDYSLVKPLSWTRTASSTRTSKMHGWHRCPSTTRTDWPSLRRDFALTLRLLYPSLGLKQLDCF